VCRLAECRHATVRRVLGFIEHIALQSDIQSNSFSLSTLQTDIPTNSWQIVNRHPVSCHLLVSGEVPNTKPVQWGQNAVMRPSCFIGKEQVHCPKSHLNPHSSSSRLTGPVPSHQRHRAPQHLACVPCVLCASLRIHHLLQLSFFQLRRDFQV